MRLSAAAAVRGFWPHGAQAALCGTGATAYLQWPYVVKRLAACASAYLHLPPAPAVIAAMCGSALQQCSTEL
jgi:hypothetical protein